MLRMSLESAGHHVCEAADGQDGLEQAVLWKFDVVISDQNMPRLNGLALILALRALPQYAATPILILTKELDADLKLKCKEAGATGWITKPFDSIRLINAVKDLLQ